MNNPWHPFRPNDDEKKVEFHPSSVIPKLDQLGANEQRTIRNSAYAAISRLFNRQYPLVEKSFRGTAEEQLLAELTFAPQRQWYLGRPSVAQFIAEKWIARDKNFFVRLGKCLQKAPMTSEPARRPKPLRAFLATNWAARDPKMPDLCFFTDEALTALCAIACDDEDLTVDKIRHERGRELGLKKSSEPLIRTVIQKAGKILLS